MAKIIAWVAIAIFAAWVLLIFLLSRANFTF